MDHARDLGEKFLRSLQRSALLNALRQRVGLRVHGGLLLAGVGPLQASFHSALLFGAEQVPCGRGLGEGLGGNRPEIIGKRSQPRFGGPADFGNRRQGAWIAGQHSRHAIVHILGESFPFGVTLLRGLLQGGQIRLILCARDTTDE